MRTDMHEREEKLQSVDELRRRVTELEALVERQRQELERSGRTRLHMGKLRIDLLARRASIDGAQLNLQPREFDLLVTLANARGEIVITRDLARSVMRRKAESTSNVAAVYVSRLRRKLGQNGVTVTTHGAKGYSLNVD